MEDEDRSVLTGLFSGGKANDFSGLLEASFRVGRWWAFRRSMGQRAIINVGYGMIAASLAQLTGGFVESGDMAWDHQLLPATPEEFLEFYFRPERSDGEWKNWAEVCIAA